MSMTLLETNLGSGAIPKRRGKVRDVYDLGDRLLLVATDRISAFDWVLPNGIPDKGRVLTGLSAYWFKHLQVPDHLISTDVDDVRARPDGRGARGARRAARCWSARPASCRSSAWCAGYLAGSGWKEYRASGTVCGIRLPAGLVESDRIDPIFTPGDQGRDRPRREHLVRTRWPTPSARRSPRRYNR